MNEQLQLAIKSIQCKQYIIATKQLNQLLALQSNQHVELSLHVTLAKLSISYLRYKDLNAKEGLNWTCSNDRLLMESLDQIEKMKVSLQRFGLFKMGLYLKGLVFARFRYLKRVALQSFEKACLESGSLISNEEIRKAAIALIKKMKMMDVYALEAYTNYSLRKFDLALLQTIILDQLYKENEYSAADRYSVQKLKAYILHSMKRYKKARKLFQKLHLQKRTDYSLALHFARVLMSLKLYPKAIKLLEWIENHGSKAQRIEAFTRKCIATYLYDSTYPGNFFDVYTPESKILGIHYLAGVFLIQQHHHSEAMLSFKKEEKQLERSCDNFIRLDMIRSKMQKGCNGCCKDPITKTLSVIERLIPQISNAKDFKRFQLDEKLKNCLTKAESKRSVDVLILKICEKGFSQLLEIIPEFKERIEYIRVSLVQSMIKRNQDSIIFQQIKGRVIYLQAIIRTQLTIRKYMKRKITSEKKTNSAKKNHRSRNMSTPVKQQLLPKKILFQIPKVENTKQQRKEELKQITRQEFIQSQKEFAKKFFVDYLLKKKKKSKSSKVSKTPSPPTNRRNREDHPRSQSTMKSKLLERKAIPQAWKREQVYLKEIRQLKKQMGKPKENIEVKILMEQESKKQKRLRNDVSRSRTPDRVYTEHAARSSRSRSRPHSRSPNRRGTPQRVLLEAWEREQHYLETIKKLKESLRIFSTNSQTQINSIHQQGKIWKKYLEISQGKNAESCKAKKYEALQHLKVILYKWTNLHGTLLPKILPYGSFALGVDSPYSDIDVVYIAPKGISKELFFQSFTVYLKSFKEAKFVRAIANTFIPVLKFIYRDIEFDVVYAQEFQDEKNLYILSCCRLPTRLTTSLPQFSKFQGAVRLLNHWASRRGIKGSRFGYLSSVLNSLLLYKLCLMNESIGMSDSIEMFKGFFDHYANYDWNQPITFLNPQVGILGNSRIPCSMVVFTPVYPPSNASFMVLPSTLFIIKKEFSRAKKKLLQNQISAVFRRSDFMTRYDVYIEITCSAKNAENFIVWKDFVSSRIRFLLKYLEGKHLYHVSPDPIQNNDLNCTFLIGIFGETVILQDDLSVETILGDYCISEFTVRCQQFNGKTEDMMVNLSLKTN